MTGQDEPQTVLRYRGMNVIGTREHIRIELTQAPERVVVTRLRLAGFRADNRNRTTWNRAHSPDAIFQAQRIGATFFTESGQ